MRKKIPNFEELKKMKFKRCKICGAPLTVAKLREWKSDGLITNIMQIAIWRVRTTNIFLMEVDDCENLFRRLKERIGEKPIQRIFEGAKAHSCETIYQCYPKIMQPFFRLMMKLGEPTRIVNFSFVKSMPIAGNGIYRVLEYVLGKKMVVEALKETIFDVPLVSGDMLCLFYLAERLNGAKKDIPLKVSWKEKAESVVFTIEYGRESKGVQEYLPIRKFNFLPGNRTFERCPVCGVPKAISENYEWVDEKWWIIEKKTGKRIFSTCFEAINRVTDALAQELGENLYQMIMEIEKDYRKKYFSQHPDYKNLKNDEESYREKLEVFPQRGMGNPVRIEKQKKNLLVRIDNIYSSPLAAGWILSLYEHIEKREAEIEYTPNLEAGEKGFAIFKVSPKIF